MTLKLTALCLSLATSGIMSASLVTFNTPVGATDSAGDPVNASAAFTTGAGTLTIAVMNKLTNQKDVGQDISDIAFFLDGKQTTGTLSSSTTTLRTVAANGSFTDSSGSSGFALQQNYTLGANTGLRLCVLCNGLGATGPSNTILGSPNASNIYSNANGSIAGNGPHNPFDTGTTTFNLSIAGVTANSTVTEATFSFGTKEGDNVNGVPVIAAVPEPATEALLGGGLLGVAFLAKKFRKV